MVWLAGADTFSNRGVQNNVKRFDNLTPPFLLLDLQVQSSNLQFIGAVLALSASILSELANDVGLVGE